MRIATAAIDPEQTSPAGPVWLPLATWHTAGQVALSALDAALPDPWAQYRATTSAPARWPYRPTRHARLTTSMAAARSFPAIRKGSRHEPSHRPAAPPCRPSRDALRPPAGAHRGDYCPRPADRHRQARAAEGGDRPYTQPPAAERGRGLPRPRHQGSVTAA